MSKFKIPLQSEVAKFIEEKKGWPKEFCHYYAERFWNFYNSNGWKVSGKAAMKSWESAFNANWQNLKYDEDIKKLAEITARTKGIPANIPKANPLGRLDFFMNEYKRGVEIPTETLCKMHDWLSERGMVRIEPDQEEIVKDICSTEETRAKAMRVKFLFMNMLGKAKTFL